MREAILCERTGITREKMGAEYMVASQRDRLPGSVWMRSKDQLNGGKGDVTDTMQMVFPNHRRVCNMRRK